MGPLEVRQVYWQVHMHTQLLLQLHALVSKDPCARAQEVAQVCILVLCAWSALARKGRHFIGWAWIDWSRAFFLVCGGSECE